MIHFFDNIINEMNGNNNCICPPCFKSIKDMDVCCHSLRLYSINCNGCQCLMNMLPRTRHYCDECSVKLSSCYLCGEVIADGKHYISKLELVIAQEIAKLNFQFEHNIGADHIIKEKIELKKKLLEQYRELFFDKTSEKILNLDLTNHYNDYRACYFFH